MPVISCGVVVTDGQRVLLGHATASPRWDIPKGLQELGESSSATALRELQEETGLVADPAALRPLGQHVYLPGKTLVLFHWQPPVMPASDTLICRSTFLLRGRQVPEFDRFACPAWMDAWPMLGKSMRAVLDQIAKAQQWPHAIQSMTASSEVT